MSVHYWAKQDEERLLELRSQRKPVAWGRIAEELARTPKACQKKLEELMKYRGMQQQIVSLERKKLALEDEMRGLKGKYRIALQDRTFEERIIDVFGDTLPRYDITPPPSLPRKKPKTVDEVAVLHLGDWHFCEVVNIDDTGGLAEYNSGIALQRLQHLAETTVDICGNKLRGYRLKKLVVFILGDIVSTNIHDLLQNTPDTAVDSFLTSLFLLSQFFHDLAANFHEVEVVGVTGNHGRITEEKKYKQRYANWDFILFQMLGLMLFNQPNISFKIPKSIFTIEKVNGWDWLLFHGDPVRAWMNIPFYGIIRALKNIRDLLELARSQKEQAGLVRRQLELEEELKKTRTWWQEQGHRFDYASMGHFHTSGSLDIGAGELFMNGAGIGTTEFSIGKMLTGSAPRHWLHGIHHEQGVSWRYNLNLGRIPIQFKQRYQMGGSNHITDEWRDLLANQI
jgi:hypothetical protein